MNGAATPAPRGPLAGLRVLELAGLGPGPFCAMVLADLGAEVLRVERTGQAPVDPDVPDRRLVLTRGRRSLGVDLKQADGVALVLDLVEHADVLLEGYRPGVLERLSLGPDACLARNPALVYGRITGYGREGPLADAPGHDINYLAIAGVLAPIGRRGEAPVPPLNLVGDFGGGGMLLAMGVLAALVERGRSGLGQVVDAAMVDGAALLGTIVYEMRGLGQWRDERGTNVVDSGAPYYDVYETADGEYLAVGAIEPAFYRSFMTGLGFDANAIPPQGERERWPAIKAQVADRIRSRTRSAWLETFEHSDACVSPVLSLGEAPLHPHNRARKAFVDDAGVATPAPAPRFSRTPAGPVSPRGDGAHELDALLDWGVSRTQVDQLRSAGIVD